MAKNDMLVKLKVAIVAIIIIFILAIFLKLYVVVGAGERAVIFNKFTGVEEGQKGEGLHFIMPFVQNPVIYDVKIHTYTMSIAHSEGQRLGDDSLECLTADGQPIWLDLSIRYRIDTDNVWKLHQEIGSGYDDVVVRPDVRSIARMVVSKYSVIELYSSDPTQILELAMAKGVLSIADSLAIAEGKTGRQRIESEIFDELKGSFLEKYIVLDAVLLRNIKFSIDFQKAIEQKQIAEQEAQRMKYVLQKEELEAQRKIIEAQADAKSIELRGEALARNRSLITYEYVQKIAPGIKTIITDQPTLMNLGNILE